MDEHTIKVWCGDFTATQANYRQYWRILDQSEQRQASSLKNEQMISRYVEGRARLRILLGSVIKAAPDKLSISRAEHGKPYLVDYPDLSFNLSHTADKMAIAIAYHCELGIDIEQCRARANLVGLADKCFAEEENHYWHQLPDTEQTQAFYQFWTRKEAFVKATGRGLALGLKQCVINPIKPSEFLRIPDGYGEANQWFIRSIALGESMCGALVAKSNMAYQSKDRNVSLHSLTD